MQLHSKLVERASITKLAVAVALALAVIAIAAAHAFGGTDYWCQSCKLYNGTEDASPYQHHNTIAYTHDLSGGHYMGAGVSGCYDIAHGYQEVTHSYSTPCLAYAIAEVSSGPSGVLTTLNAHDNF